MSQDAEHRSPLEQFAEQLGHLRRESGEPSLRELEESALDLGYSLPRSTISDVLNAKSLPSEHFVPQFVETCFIYSSRDLSELDRQQWQKAYLRLLQKVANQRKGLRQSSEAALKLATLARDVSSEAKLEMMRRSTIEHVLSSNPVTYGVHPTLSSGQGEGLTRYVKRSSDEDLARCVEDAVSGKSRITILVGESSVGKTRACWESLRLLPSNWGLWQPLSAEKLLGTLGSVSSKSMRRQLQRTVIWLDELHNFISASTPELSERVAVELRGLLSDDRCSPVLIIGTIWVDTERWGSLVREPAPGEPDSLNQSRKLLSGAAIPISNSLRAAASDLAEAVHTDPRWRAALEHDKTRPIQFFAGAHYLMERYETATLKQRSLLDAASDASRIGILDSHKAEFLQLAVCDYLSPNEQHEAARNVTSYSVVETLSHPKFGLLTGGKGVGGLFHKIVPVGDDDDSTYRLSDFIEQHGTRQRLMIQPKDSLWHAANLIVKDSSTRFVVAEAARDRGRFNIAAQIHASTGGPRAFRSEAQIWENAGVYERVRQLLTKAADMGDSRALYELGIRVRRDAGTAKQRREAERLLKEASVQGDSLARLYVYREKLRIYPNAAMKMLAKWVNEGDRLAADELRIQLDKQAAKDSLKRLLEWQISQGERGSIEHLAILLEKQGLPVQAEALWRRAAESGQSSAWYALSRRLERRGDLAGGEECLELGTRFGDRESLYLSWWRCTRLGDDTRAEEYALRLANIRAHSLRKYSAASATPYTSWLVFKTPWKYGEDTLVAASAGNTSALDWLTNQGFDDDAVKCAKLGASIGLRGALDWLVSTRQEQLVELAERLATTAADAGYPGALHWVAKSRTLRGDPDAATDLLRCALAAGDRTALSGIAKIAESGGDVTTASQLRRYGVDANGRPASSI